MTGQFFNIIANSYGAFAIFILIVRN